VLVAYGLRRRWQAGILLAFLREPGESQADWRSLLERSSIARLEGQALGLILTDACCRLWGAAIRTVLSARWRHQRLPVHKMRNISRESAAECSDYTK